MAPPKVRTSQLAFVACFAFVGLGLPDAVLGVAWPSIAESISQPLHRIGWLVSISFLSYLAGTLSASRSVSQLGLAGLLLASSLAMVGVLTGVSLTHHWTLLLLLAAISGYAGGSIDAAMNAFASEHFSATWINWMHGCWGIGASLGPCLMTTLLVLEVSWRTVYQILSLFLLAVCVALFATRHHWTMQDRDERGEGPSQGIGVAIRDGRVRWMCLLYWIYTAVEATTGYLGYSYLTTERNYSVATAGYAVSGFWGMLTIGRLLMGPLLAWLSWKRVLRIHAGLAVIASALVVSGSWVDHLDLIGTVLLGFALAPIFPTWIAKTPGYVGSLKSHSAIGLQIGSAAIGVATFPLFVGQMAHLVCGEVFPWSLLVCSVAFAAIQERPMRV